MWSRRSSTLVLATVLLGCAMAQLAAAIWNPRLGKWTPKTDKATYDPRNKDWGDVVEDCKRLGQREKRLMNFFIRAAFHDSLSVDVSACDTEGGSIDDCGGADSSLLLNEEEMSRPENNYDQFSKITSNAAIRIARRNDVSVSDVLAVCSVVGIELLSKGRVEILDLGALRLGRLDSMNASPQNQLPAADATASSFTSFWEKRGFTAEEGVALMGSHSLIDEQACLLPNGRTKCDPFRAPCQDLRMYQWDNHFFHDACVPTIEISRVEEEGGEGAEGAEVEVKQTRQELQQERRNEMCKFTSLKYRAKALYELAREKANPELAEPVEKQLFSVKWLRNGCEHGKAWGANESCPHLETEWPYTVNDAFSGLACQGKAENTADNNAVRDAMRKFLNEKEWDKVLIPTFLKMLTARVRWSDVGKEGVKLQPQCSVQRFGRPKRCDFVAVVSK